MAPAQQRQETVPGAVIIDGPGPWRDESWTVAVGAFRRLLEEAGYKVQAVPPAGLAKALEADSNLLVAAPSLEFLPVAVCNVIAAHTAHGGSLLATGGEPFREPLYPAPGGQWKSAKELLAFVSRRVILEFASTPLHRNTAPPQGVVTQMPAKGPDGRTDSLQVRVDQYYFAGWWIDPLQTDPASASPFHDRETLTIVTVRGTPEESLFIDWVEDDDLRWTARVPLSAEWQTHVLRPSDFSLIPRGGTWSGVPRPRFDPLRARAFAFNLATDIMSQPAPSTEFTIAPVAVGTAPAMENFEVPVLQTISPWYKQYDAKRQGRTVRVPIARQRGLVPTTETEGRYQAIGDLVDPAASRFVTSKGAVYFWMPSPQLAGRERQEFVELLQQSSRRVALLNGGPGEIVSFAGEPLRFGAQVLNASSQPVTTKIAWTVRAGNNRVAEEHQSVELAAGETRAVTVTSSTTPPPGEYQVVTALHVSAVMCDRVDGFLRVVDLQALRRPQRRIRVEKGHLTAAGKRVYLNGVNYWPRWVSGQESGRSNDQWLSSRNYDPEVVEADLTVLERLRFNFAIIQFQNANQARQLTDFLERCRAHGIWVHLSIGSASNLRLNPQRDTGLFSAAPLAGNDTVLGYEIAWEPNFGEYTLRKVNDAAWRKWIEEQYGTLAAAESLWGVPAPRDEQGNVTGPSDQLTMNDGPHRNMVAAYRRFADDLISRVYGRVVRHLRSLDPEGLIAIRTGPWGTGTELYNSILGYDLVSGAAHVDAIGTEAYQMLPDFELSRKIGFIIAYARWAGNRKPVLSMEFGNSLGPRGGTSRTRKTQARVCETMMHVIADSGGDGSAAWWFPGGWRIGERSDFGIMNPDGSPRDSARALTEWERQFASAPPLYEDERGEPVVLEMDRDADARGLYGLGLTMKEQYLKARQAGRPVRLKTLGTGTDTGSMPLIQVGNLPYKGTGPLKYANAEFAEISITWPGGEQVVENGAEPEVGANAVCEIHVSLINTGEASWLRGGSDGGCNLRTSAGDAPVLDNVERFGKTTIGPFRVSLGKNPLELTGRMAAAGRGSFGENLRLLLRPRT